MTRKKRYLFSYLLLALALVFFTRKQIRKLFQERRDRIADALGRAADAQDQARHTAEDIAEAQQAADAEARAQLAEAKAQAEANTAAADAETAREAVAVRRGVEQTEAQLRSDMEDRVSDAAIGRITAATAGVLTQDEMGVADLIIKTTSILYPVVSLSIGQAVIRYGLERRRRKPDEFTKGQLTEACGFLIS